MTRREGDRIVAGSEAAGVFFEIEPETARALDLLGRGERVRDVRDRLRDETGEDCDVDGLVAALLSQGVVAEVDGAPVPAPEWLRDVDATPAPGDVRFKWMHGWAFALLVLAAGLGTAAAFLWDNLLVPHPRDVTGVTSNTALSLAITIGTGLGLAALHEFGHWAMARSFGVRARVSVSARVLIPVLQTEVTRAWMLPRTPRLLVFLAGMAVNVLVTGVFVCGLVLAWQLGFAVPHGVYRFVKLVAFVNLFQIAFQFLLFLRTDVYYAFTTITGEWNLHEDVRRTFARTATRVTRRALGKPPVRFEDDGLRHARHTFAFYSLVLTAGTLLAGAYMTFVLGAILTRVLPGIPGRLAIGLALSDWTAVVESLLLAGYLTAFLVIVSRFFVLASIRRFIAWLRFTLADAPTARS